METRKKKKKKKKKTAKNITNPLLQQGVKKKPRISYIINELQLFPNSFY